MTFKAHLQTGSQNEQIVLKYFQQFPLKNLAEYVDIVVITTSTSFIQQIFLMET
jgi:hypothetical protein